MRALLSILLFCQTLTALAGEVHVAVAANFRTTAETINALYTARYGNQVILSSGSTGVLHSQISAGAPFDILLAADRDSPESLVSAGFGIAAEQFCYARGQLALVGSNRTLEDLNNPRLSLAIGNPQTAPYGRAAWEVLQRPEFAEGAARKLIRAANVAQAYQHRYTGAVDLALVARALAPSQGVGVPADWHSPIEQDAILLERARENEAAGAYLAFLRSGEIQTLITDAGYLRCQ